MAENVVAVAGLFEDYETAATAVQALERAGLHRVEISLVSNDADTKQAERLDESARNPAVAGAAVGGVVGGSVTALAALTALAIPGVGPVVAADFVAAALGGAAVGGLAGALAIVVPPVWRTGIGALCRRRSEPTASRAQYRRGV
jgi:hypothetical protein